MFARNLEKKNCYYYQLRTFVNLYRLQPRKVKLFSESLDSFTVGKRMALNENAQLYIKWC